MEEKHKSKKRKSEDIIKNIQTISSNEDKIRYGLESMKEFLSSKDSDLKGFWAVKKICLELLREDVASPAKSSLWEEYIDITKEGRVLKNMLDEESAFAVEQIDKAITALEEEAKLLDGEQEGSLDSFVSAEFTTSCVAVERRLDYYMSVNKRLNFFEVMATKINSFRGELMKTEMRIKRKNSLFERLAVLGNIVFPKRKELIVEVSSIFVEDVKAFVEDNFVNNGRRGISIFFYRNEIRALQAIAKMLNLNAEAFSFTREELSKCWDRLKEIEKEQKKVQVKDKAKSAENTAFIREKLKEITAEYEENAISMDTAIFNYNSLTREMRNVELILPDIKALKKEIRDLVTNLEDAKALIEDEKKKKDKEFEAARYERVNSFKTLVVEFETELTSEGKKDIPQLASRLDSIKKSLLSISANKNEKLLIEQHLKNCKNVIADLKEQAVLCMSDCDREAIENLHSVFKQRLERRKEIKEAIEQYRKISGSSSLDFEQAIRYSDLINEEKQKLAKIDESIAEIDRKIQNLKHTSEVVNTRAV